jgi:hypothetical protein
MFPHAILTRLCADRDIYVESIPTTREDEEREQDELERSLMP